MKTLILTLVLPVIAAGVQAGENANSQSSTRTTAERDRLEQEFVTPPDTARPYIWWRWMGAYVNKDAVIKDLKAFKDGGLHGVLLEPMNDALPRTYKNGTKPVPGLVTPFGPEWWDVFKTAVSTARDLGMEVMVANCPGYDNTGGPWITPEASMKRVVWSETDCSGPAAFDAVLPMPPTFLNYYKEIAVLAVPASGEPDPGAVVDLTGKMDAAGKLVWNAPAGDWKILRFGQTTTGETNGPITPEGKGLEVDRFDSRMLKIHFDAYPKKIAEMLGDLTGKTMTAFYFDSYETGFQNWSANFREEFRKRRGYDILPWLPVLTGGKSEPIGKGLKQLPRGRVMGSPERTERFVWDYHRTITELTAEEFHKAYADMIHQYPGVKMVLQPYGTAGTPFSMGLSGICADIPAGEFWHEDGKPEVTWWTLDLVASMAHTTGRDVVSAESFTASPQDSRWGDDPYALKPGADMALAMGINRFELQLAALQALEGAEPGLLPIYGPRFGRVSTWWGMSRGWTTYLARCCQLLRQGRFIGDIAVLDPTINFNTSKGRLSLPKFQGYKAELLAEPLFLRDLKVQNGKLILPSGMEYRLLVLPEQPTMTLPVLRRLRELVNEGAVVLGPKPLTTPGLQDYPKCDEEVRRIADEIWGAGPAPANGFHACGKGRVYVNAPVEKILAELGVDADVRFPASVSFKSQPPGRVLPWIHRKAGDADIYFLSNQKAEPVDGEFSFRVDGKLPELWDAATGKIRRAACWQRRDGRTVIPLKLDAFGSVFVVFRQPAPDRIDPVASVQGPGAEPRRLERSADGKKLILEAFQPGDYVVKTVAGRTISFNVKNLPPELPLDGAWQIKFPPDRGAPESATFEKLISWSEHPEPGIKYFSGTAIYSKEIEVPQGYLADNQKVYLNLGDVKNLARVTLNGKEAGICWKAPFEIEVTDYLKPGKNSLQVEAANLWPNRFIGDAQEPEDVEWEKETFSDKGKYRGKIMKELPAWFVEKQPRPSKNRRTLSWMMQYTGKEPLLPSGLLGPVTLRCSRRVAAAVAD